MSGYTPTDGEVLTAVVLYRAIASVDAPPPAIETIATPEETARYLGEYRRWLAEHDAKVRAEALRDAATWVEDLAVHDGLMYREFDDEEEVAESIPTALRVRADRIERKAGLK